MTISKIPKFRRFVLQNFPFIEQDFDALTDYELLCKVVEYLNNVIDSQNEVTAEFEALSGAFTELNNYVSNYFDNLDVQEEINNKLDAMVEDGTLQEIITDYLNTQALFIYDNVAAMKSATNLINGSFAKTLGYYAKNDGGSAIYKITSTLPSSYYETLTAGLYAELITDVANVKMFGAKGDGLTDDAPKIRNAIAYLKATGNNTLYFPVGSYYINSGDPRGLTTSGTYSNTDYYTCFEIIDNMKIVGDGEASVLKYNSNRLGYKLDTNRGDVGAIFANFRVNSPNENYAVNGTVEIKNIKVEYTELASGEKNVRDYIDGQLIRVNTSNYLQHNWVQNYNGNFIFENITIENMPGHQIFNVTGGNKVTAKNINIHNVGKINNSANTDHSSFFINAQVCDIDNCKVYCDSQSSGTAFEIHSTFSTITNCYTEYNSTFANLIGNVNDYPSDYIVANNVCNKNKYFIRLWPFSDRTIKNLRIHDNNITINYSDNLTDERILQNYSDTAYTGAEKPIENIEFHNNYCTTEFIDNTTVASTGNYDYAFKLSLVESLKVTNNIFNNFRRGLIYVSEESNLASIRSIDISNNQIEKIGLRTETSFKTPAIYVNIPASYKDNNVAKNINIENNVIDLRSRTAQSGQSQGIYFNFRPTETDTNTKVRIIENYIDSATTEVTIYGQNAAGTSDHNILFVHKYHNAITNVNDSLLTSAVSTNFMNGTCIEGTLNNYMVKATITGSDQIKTVLFVNNVAPTSGGYFKKGSIAYNLNPSFTNESPYAWICTTAGASGTWSPINPTTG